MKRLVLCLLLLATPASGDFAGAGSSGAWIEERHVPVIAITTVMHDPWEVGDVIIIDTKLVNSEREAEK